MESFLNKILIKQFNNISRFKFINIDDQSVLLKLVSFTLFLLLASCNSSQQQSYQKNTSFTDVSSKSIITLSYYKGGLSERGWCPIGNGSHQPMIAVKFTPTSYPVTLLKARFFVTNGSGSERRFSVHCVADQNGIPSIHQKLSPSIENVIAPNSNWNSGVWVEVELSPTVIYSGNFWIVMEWQTKPLGTASGNNTHRLGATAYPPIAPERVYWHFYNWRNVKDISAQLGDPMVSVDMIPVAEVPRLFVGDSWTLESATGVRVQKIVEINHNGSFVTETVDLNGKPLYRSYFDNNWRLEMEIDLLSGKNTDVAKPPIHILNFPLYLGKKWNQKSYTRSIDGLSYNYEFFFEVAGIESVNTKAGTFKAVKIAEHQTNLEKGFRNTGTHWYSPELKRIIKQEFSHRKGFELVRYSMAQPDQEPPFIEITSPTLSNDRLTVNKDSETLHIRIKDESAIKWVKINSQDVIINGQGELAYPAALSKGENEVEIRASDVHANESVKKVTLRYEEPAPAVPPAAVAATAPVLRDSAVRWAVVVGLSSYHDTRIPSLRYAAADASSLYKWLVSPDGGKFAPSRVKLLTNAEATAAKIRESLFSWLRGALEEDIVVIYFSGHGSPDSPDSRDNLFLLPYDADYGNIAATSFPMWDIETALKRFIKARKVIVIADACHAGGVGQAYDVARKSSKGILVNPISTALHNLSQAGDGVCVLSASDKDQYSQEGQNWGGGHGVFTYYLLEGLKGAADYNKDGSVSLGELIPYLSEQVRRATNSTQSPTVAGRFDPALTIGK